MLDMHLFYSFFFFNDTATTEIYTLSLHDALPIFSTDNGNSWTASTGIPQQAVVHSDRVNAKKFYGFWQDRKSTRLNSSHGYISYAVFCLKKKKKKGRAHTVEWREILRS